MARFALLLLVSLATSAGAQQAPHGIADPRPSAVLGVAARGPLRQSLLPDSVRRDIRPTQWKKGALIGAVVTGVGLALMMDGLCTPDSNCHKSPVVPALVAGGAVGALIGALIGGQFPKEEAP
jgi:hypothetical protein